MSVVALADNMEIYGTLGTTSGTPGRMNIFRDNPAVTILHKCNQGTNHYNCGLGALYPLPKKVKGLGKKAVAKAFATACRQRYKNAVTAKKMFHCQLLVWSQLAVSEGFGGITYCLANSNCRISHGSVS